MVKGNCISLLSFWTSMAADAHDCYNVEAVVNFISSLHNLRELFLCYSVAHYQHTLYTDKFVKIHLYHFS